MIAGDGVGSVAVAPLGDATATYYVSNITAYGAGVKRDGTFYYGDGDVVSLTLAHSDRPGYTCTGYTASAGTLSGDDTAGYTLAMPDGDVTVTATFAPNPAHFEKTGENEYTIHTATGWNVFCDMLEDNAKGIFSNKTVRLDADIAVTRMAGMSQHDFTGTFDGQKHRITVSYTSNNAYAAPFRNVEDGCVIENLRVDGTITTSAQNAAGIIGNQFGTVTIRNCRSSVTIKSSVAGDGTHGGLVAVKGNTANLTIEGCVFDGKIISTGTTATTKCGGFVGWRKDNGTLTIKNCVYAPADDDNAVTVGATFSRNGGTITNCYYTRALDTAQGKEARAVIAGDGVGSVTVAPVGDTTATYGVSNITAYGAGVKRDGTFYYGDGDVVSLTLAHSDRPGYTCTGYTASAGTLSGDDTAGYTLTMPDEDVTVSATFSAWKWLRDEMAKNNNTITLTRDIACDDQSLGPLVVPQGVTVTLDLNGHVIDRALTDSVQDGHVIDVKGKLTVKDSDASATHDPAITYADPTDPSKPVTVTGGVITGGNTAERGGGVYVRGVASFTMHGGEVSGNTAKWGGGVYVAGGSFTMGGGEVSGNAAAWGGGVCVYGSGSFKVSGGAKVTGNNAELYGEDVNLDYESKIVINGPLTDGARMCVYMYSPGVFTEGYRTTMGTYDPASYFTSENSGYGMCLNAGGEAELREAHTVTVDGCVNGRIAVKPARDTSLYCVGETVTLTASPDAGYGLDTLTVKQGTSPVTVTDNSFTMPAGGVTVSATFSAWKWLQDEMAKGGKITLTRDIACDDQSLGPLVVPAGVDVTLDLNGHVIDRALTDSVQDGHVITVNGTLTVEDGNASATHDPAITYADPTDPSKPVTVTGGVITGGNTASSYGGGVCVEGGGSLTMKGGEVSGNAAEMFGGGVYVQRGGSFTMKGGEVSGNTAKWCGGVYVGSKGSFTMDGGAVCGNAASSDGGVYVNDGGSFTMDGGEVSGNAAEWGGGVYVQYGASFTMDGGEVSGNAAEWGGGVYVAGGSFKVSGGAKVTGNNAEHGGKDVDLEDESKIVIDGPLTDGARIGVHMYSPGVFTEGYRTTMGTYDPASYFTSENSGYGMCLNASGEAELREAHTVTVDGCANGRIAVKPARDTSLYCVGETVTLTASPDAGYGLDTLTVKQGTSPVTVTDNSFTMPAGGVTVGATFSPIPATAPTIGTQPGDLSLAYGYTTGNVLSVEASAAEGHTLSYQWYSNTSDANQGGTAIDDATEASYAVPVGKGAGTTEHYYCVVTATRTDNGQTADTTSDVATVTIGKATPTISIAPTASAITYGQTLAVSTLSGGAASVAGGFAWTDGSVAPKVSDSGKTDYGVTFTPTDTTNYNTATTTVKLTVNPKPVTITGLSASGKVYDGGVAATATGAAAIEGLVGSDVVAVDATAGSAAFADADAGDNKAVNFTGYALSGKDAGNYTLSEQPTSVEANITARGITVTAKGQSVGYGGSIATGLDKVSVTSGTLVGGHDLSGITVGLAQGRDTSAVGEYDGAIVLSGATIKDESDHDVTANYAVTYAPGKLTVTKVKAKVTTAPKAITNLKYTGRGQQLVEAGVADTAMEYAIGTDATTAPTGGYSATVPSATDANNTYHVWYRAKEDANHVAGDPAVLDVAIGKAPLTVTAKPKTITYGDAPANDGVTYTGFVNNETQSVLGGTLAFDYSYAQYGSVGNTYTITPKGLTSDNYEPTFKPGTLTVGQKEVGLSWSNTPLTYNCSAQAPAATATGTVNGDEVAVTVTGAQTNAGTGYTATASALTGDKAGNYRLPSAKTQGFSIGKAAARAIADVTKIQLHTLTGVSASVAGRMPKDAGQLTYSAGEPTTTGGVTVSDFAVGADGTVSATLSGGAAGDTVTLPVTVGSTNYADSVAKVVVTLTAKSDAGVSVTGVPTEAKTYGDADFRLTGSVTNAGDGTGAWTWESSDSTVLQITPDGATATVRILRAGSAAVTAKYESNTTIGAETAATIEVSKKAVTIQAKDQSIYVGGTVPTLGSDSYTVTGLVGEETLVTPPTLAYQRGGVAATPTSATAGSYDIVASGANAGANYAISYTNGTLTINEKGKQTITAPDVAATYGDTDKKVSARVTDPATGGGTISYAVKGGSGDYIAVDGTTGALTIKGVPAGGRAYVTVTATETDTHKQATKDVTVTIGKANAAAATVGANNRTYDGKEGPLVTAAGEATGGEMRYALGESATKAPADSLYAASIPSKTDAGTYYVWYKAMGDTNHADTEPDSVEVTIAKATIKPAVALDGWTYGDGAKEPSVTGNPGKGTVTYQYKAKGAEDGAFGTSVPKDAGAYTVRATVAETGNYKSGTATADFTIARRAATVKADDKEKAADDADPELTATVTNAVEGDTINYSLERAAGEGVGTYAITVQPGENPNYDVKAEGGTLTVNKGHASVKKEPAAKELTFDGKAHALVDPGEAEHGEMAYALGDGTATAPTEGWSTSVPTGTDAGTYRVWYKAEGDANHADTEPASVEVTVSKATIDPKVTHGGWTYGDTAKEPTVDGNHGKGQVTYQYKAKATGDEAYDTAAPTNAGDYTVRATVPETGNYKSGTVAADFTIARRAATVKADDKEKAVDDTDPKLTATVTNAVKGDAINYTLARAAGEGVGTYAITVTLGENPNYDVKAEGGTLTIKESRASVKAAPTARNLTYSGKPQVLVEAGSAEHGDMAYVLGDGTATAPTDGWSTSVPTATDAGTYRVWYKAEGDDNHAETEPASVEVTVSKATIKPAVTLEGWTYGDVAKEPAVTGNTGGATVTYQYKAKAAGDDAFGASVPNDTGDYTVRATVAETNNYKTGTATADFTIARRPVTVKADDKEKAVDDADPELTATITNAVSGDAIDYTLTRKAGNDIGTYEINVILGNNPDYDVKAEAGTLTVNKGRASVKAKPAARNLTYDGSAQALVEAGSAEHGEMRYALGESATKAPADSLYAASIPSKTNAGTYYVWYKAMGDANHADTEPDSVEVTIAKATIKPAVTLEGWTYGDAAKEPTVDGNPGKGTVTYQYKAKGAEDSSYDTAVPTDAGDYTVRATVAETNNYKSGTAAADFTIARRPVTVKADDKEKAADEADPELTATVTNAVSGETIKYTLARDEGDNVGTYAICVTPGNNPNYDVTAEPGKLTIKEGRASVKAAPTARNLTYDGSAQALVEAGSAEHGEMAYALGDGTATAPTDGWSTSVPTATDAGTYRVWYKAEGDASHADTEPVSLEVTVSKAAIDPKVALGGWTYGDAAKEPAVTGNTGGAAVTYQYKAKAAGDDAFGASVPNDAGDYTVRATVAETNNYKPGSATADFTIAKRPATVKADDKQKAADDADPELTATVANVVPGETIDYSLSRNEGDAVGTYAINVSLGENPNYDVKAEGGTLTIKEGRASVKKAPTARELTYSGKAQALIVAGSAEHGEMQYTLGDGTATAPTDGWATSVPTATDAGTYRVWYKAAGDANHADTEPDSVEATISKATIDPKVTLGGWTYGDAAKEPTVDGNPGKGTVTYQYKAKAAGNKAYDTAVPTNAGDYTVRATVSETNNYKAATATADFTIARRPVTVKADDLERSVDDADPELTATVTNAAEGDTISYTLSREPGEGVGTYAITVRPGENPNYDVEAEAGTLTIKESRASVKTKPTARNLTYDGSAQALIVAGSAEHGEMAYALGDGTATAPTEGWSTSVPTGTDAGTYRVWYKAAGDANHADTEPDSVEVTIAKATIDPKVTLGGWTYGDTAKEPTVTGNAGKGAVTYEYKAKTAEDGAYATAVPGNAGNYTVQASIAATANYKEATATADFTIARRPVTVKADDKEKAADEADPELTATVANVVPGETINYSLSRNEGDAVGTYAINVQPGENPNYDVTAKAGTLTIKDGRASVKKAPTARELTYSGKAQALVDPGEAEHGEMAYALGDESGPTEDYQSSVPTAVHAGEYHVWYKVEGDESHADTAEDSVTVRVGRMAAPKTTEAERPRANEGLAYTGKSQSLVVAPESLPEGYEGIRYSADGGKTWSDDVPGGTDAGDYTVAVSYVGDGDHEDFDGDDIHTSIAKAAAPALSGTQAPKAIEGLTYTGSPQQLVAGPESLPEGYSRVLYAVGDANGSYSATIPVATDAGTYDVWYVATGDGNHEDTEPATVEATISKATIRPVVTLEGWTYGDAAEEPAVDGNPGEGQVTYQYKDKAAGDDGYDATVPNDAGDYTVRATIAGTANYFAAAATADFTIARRPVTVKADDLERSVDDAEPELTATVTNAAEGDTISYTLSREPGEGVGTYAITVQPGENPNYDVEALAGTLTIKKGRVSVKAAPKARELTYDGSLQALVEPGEAEHGEMRYALGDGSGPTEGYRQSVPTATQAGDYHVWYMVVGDGNHEDLAGGDIVVTVAKASAPALSGTQVPKAIEGLSYTGSPQQLVAGPESLPEGYGQVLYAVGDENGAYSATIPTATDAGTYDVWYVAKGDNNHEDTEPASLGVTISKAAISPSVTARDWTYGDGAEAPEVAGNPGGGQVTYEYAAGDGSSLGASVPRNAGLYTVWAQIAETINHLSGIAQDGFRILRRPATVTVESKAKALGEADPALTAVVEGAIAGDAIDYSLSRDPGEDAGAYAISVTLGDNPNYDVATVGGYLTINPADAPSVGQAQAPTARTGLTYTGWPQPLVDAPAEPLEGYTVKYSTDAGQTWSTEVPTATEAGTYVVGVLYVGDQGQPDFRVDDVTVTIGAAPDTVPTAAQTPAAKDGLAYTGDAQDLVEAPSVPMDGYTVEYSADGGATWSKSVPKATDAGTYTVRVRYSADDGNHDDFEGASLTVTIAKAPAPVPTAAQTPTAASGLTYTGKEQGLVEAPSDPIGGYAVEYSADGGQTWSRDVPRRTDAGSYEVRVRYAATDNNRETFEGDALTATIARAALELKDGQRPTAKDGLTRTDERQELVNAPVNGLPDGCSMLYAIGSDGTTAPTGGWDTAVPTATEAGTYHVWYLAEGDGNHTDTEPAVLTVSITDSEASYHYEVGGTAWTEGSDQGLALTFKRSSGDETTFGHFAGVAVDGSELRRDVDYTAKAGSVVVTLLPSYLKTLSVGTHTLEVRFDDGDSVYVEFTVTRPSGSGGSGSTDGSDPANGSKSDPKGSDSGSRETTGAGLAYGPLGLGWPGVPYVPTMPVFRDRAPLSGGAALPTTTGGSTGTGTSGSTATGTPSASPSAGVGTPVGGTGATATGTATSAPTPVPTVSGTVASARTGAQDTVGGTASAVPAAKSPTAATGDPTLVGVVVPMAAGGLALAAAGRRRRQR